MVLDYGQCWGWRGDVGRWFLRLFRILADERLSELCALHPLGYRPTILWKNLRVTAGQAIYSRRTIGLSAILLTTEERVLDTLDHEYAHLLAIARHGKRGMGHGPAWRQAMADLGRPATVRHRYEVERNASRQSVIYHCQICCEKFQRKKRLPQRRKYLHVNCGGEIHLEKVIREPCG